MNGTGKSTLLRIINGEYSISGGSLNKAKGLSLGFFNQDLLSFESDDSIHGSRDDRVWRSPAGRKRPGTPGSRNGTQRKRSNSQRIQR
ncbi:hypothetical protein MKQ70_09515 [Chitinophaga sedimenti]|uniref:hypothetical protein n=1 Tax=Chitinophaga sedimenti TaxID=2033606 RepID=UPI002005851C|nr:hypothetical protein [Chitinophaga sedimenti]MCK7555228.1 hypothetical protein [Chitinophaga sedimenti]